MRDYTTCSRICILPFYRRGLNKHYGNMSHAPHCTLVVIHTFWIRMMRAAFQVFYRELQVALFLIQMGSWWYLKPSWYAKQAQLLHHLDWYSMSKTVKSFCCKKNELKFIHPIFLQSSIIYFLRSLKIYMEKISSILYKFEILFRISCLCWNDIQTRLSSIWGQTPFDSISLRKSYAAIMCIQCFLRI